MTTAIAAEADRARDNLKVASFLGPSAAVAVVA